jgi:acetylornithine deacetylase/succinyl-diaminopimelate desuccinylase-like protein
MHEELSRVVSRRLPEAVADVQRLCRQPSVSAQRLGMAETRALVAAMVEEAGGRSRVLEDVPGIPTLQAEFDGESERTLLFYDHYDVQPAEPVEEWTTPPWSADLRDGKVYARGACDNKGNIVARLWALRVLRELQGRLPCRVKFLIEGEEEIGSPNLPAILERHAPLFAADACIWEFGSRDEQERVQIYAGVKGMCYLELTCRTADVDMHSSLGAIVENPAWRLVQALVTLRSPDGAIHVAGHTDRVPPLTPADREAARTLPFEGETLRRAYGLRRPYLTEAGGRPSLEALMFDPTCTICGLEAGYTGPGAKTVLPREARAKLDFRLVPDQDPAEVARRVREHLDAHGFSDITLTEFSMEHAYRVPLDDPFLALVSRTAEEAYGAPVMVYPSSGGTGPMHVVAHSLRLPIAGTGVDWWGARAHAPDESMRVSDLEAGMRHMAHLLVEFAAASKK